MTLLSKKSEAAMHLHEHKNRVQRRLSRVLEFEVRVDYHCWSMWAYEWRLNKIPFYFIFLSIFFIFVIAINILFQAIVLKIIGSRFQALNHHSKEIYLPLYRELKSRMSTFRVPIPRRKGQWASVDAWVGGPIRPRMKLVSII